MKSVLVTAGLAPGRWTEIHTASTGTDHDRYTTAIRSCSTHATPPQDIGARYDVLPVLAMDTRVALSRRRP
ncbi:MAG: hypothetical protein U5O39_00425 [Gammaproteobacteria bacterium]|nr:hypothetical protein [Gammaproteobacteria bacterium]